MTAQTPDRLVNAHADLDLAGYHLFGVVIEDPTSRHGKPYPFKSKATPDARMASTAIARGYISLFRLNAAGRLTLKGFAYLTQKGRAPDMLDEELEGDFWLVFRQTFFGDSVYLPFRNGIVVSDRSQWRHVPSPGNPLKALIVQKEHACSALIRVRCVDGGPLDWSGLKIYVDGNVHRTPPRLGHQASPVLEVIPIEPGPHRIVVRECQTPFSSSLTMARRPRLICKLRTAPSCLREQARDPPRCRCMKSRMSVLM
jgi:hypothetical protein